MTVAERCPNCYRRVVELSVHICPAFTPTPQAKESRKRPGPPPRQTPEGRRALANERQRRYKLRKKASA